MNSFKYSFEEFQGIQTGKRKSSPVDLLHFFEKASKKLNKIVLQIQDQPFSLNEQDQSCQ